MTKQVQGANHAYLPRFACSHLEQCRTTENNGSNKTGRSWLDILLHNVVNSSRPWGIIIRRCHLHTTLKSLQPKCLTYGMLSQHYADATKAGPATEASTHCKIVQSQSFRSQCGDDSAPNPAQPSKTNCVHHCCMPETPPPLVYVCYLCL